jgi:GTP-binding protein Era
VNGYRAGLVTIAGRPNVGKSTLVNRLVGAHVSITSRRPQTTRHRVLGIKTTPTHQLVLVDTPGLHSEQSQPLNRYMNRLATGSLAGVDGVVFVITAGGWRTEDDYPFERVVRYGVPVILAINKIDKLENRKDLLALIEKLKDKFNFKAVVPLSATKGDNVENLEKELEKCLPEQPPIYSGDQITDRSERFLAQELVREQIFRRFGQEVPYASTVWVDSLKRAKGALEINATVWVEKDGQRIILIGKGGSALKEIGTAARLAMQKLFGTKVRLHLWVKVRRDWSSNVKFLQTLGYRDEG